MNPQQDQTPGLGLPQPSFDMGQAPTSRAAEAFKAPDVTMPSFEAAQSPMPAAPPVQSMPMPAIAQPQTQQPAAPVAPIIPASQQDMSAAAAAAPSEDSDDSALDEEWVNKAREIVERTHSDPFLQSREISKIKAQYIKVRYNKDIKSSEDQP